eukprot:248285_1
MSNNTTQDKVDNRGTKRNSTDLLSTNNNNNNTQNPHPSKKQRTSKEKYATTLQSLLQMSPSEINALPEPFKTQAIALRQKRNITNKSNQPNNNIKNTNFNINSQQPVSLISDESENESDQEMEYISPKQQQNVNPINNVHAQNNYNNTNRRNNNNIIYSHNNTFHNSNTASRIPGIPPQKQQPPHAQMGGNVIISDTQTALHYNQQTFQPVINDVHSNSNTNTNSYTVPRYINVQDLIAEPDNNNKNNCGFCYKLWFIICMILLFMPFFMSIQWSNSYGTNYCDTNADIIGVLNKTDCIPCPMNAKYCIKGKARCANKYMVDNESNECVVISYKKNVINAYKNSLKLVVNGGNNVMSYCYDEILKWKSVEEWKLWWKKIWSLSFVEFCKFYEMEIMISFFVFTWYFPVFRLLIIFLWSRMVLPIVYVNDHKTDQDEWIPIVIGLKVLSYFAPIMFGYVVWNKFATYFA